MRIDRDNLLARIDWCVSESGKDAAQVMTIRDSNALISVMPEVHREVKVTPMVHGRWELVDAADPMCYECSKCSCLSWFEPYRYCPNCGARMDLEEQDGTDNP